MYNDYYLQEISSKITITNNKLTDIIENQELIISGDKDINNNIIHNNETTFVVAIIMCLTLLLTFIMRCLK